MIIEELVTILGVDVKSDGVSDLVKGVTKATVAIGGFVFGVKSISDALGAAFNAAADNDELSKFAAGLDLTTQSIERLEFAGSRFGFGELRGSLKSLREEIDKIQSGDVQGAVSLSRLGIDLNELRDANGELIKADRLLALIADGFRNSIGTNNESFARIAASNLGFSSPESQAFLASGSARILELGRVAEESGAVASNSAIKTSRNIIRATPELAAAVDGLVNTHLVPGLDKVAEFTDEISAMIREMNQRDSGDLWIVDQFRTLEEFMRMSQALFDEIGSSIRAVDNVRVSAFGGDALADDAFADPFSAGAALATSSRQGIVDFLQSIGVSPDTGIGPANLGQALAPFRDSRPGATINIENDVKIIGSPDPEGNRRKFEDFNIHVMRSGLRDATSGIEN